MMRRNYSDGFGSVKPKIERPRVDSNHRPAD